MTQIAHEAVELSGRVRSGAGQGAGFTQLNWVREQLVALCGIDPFPGTLNIRPDSSADHAAWRAARLRSDVRLRSPDSEFCDADVLRVRIADRISAAIVLPDIAGYPDNQIEIVCAVGLREHIEVQDDDRLRLRFGPETPAVETVIFDVDGTLLNSLDGYQLAASRATASRGYTVSIEHVRQALDTNQPFWDFVVPPGNRKDDALIAELRSATLRHWPAALREVVRVIPGSAGMLARLRAAGLRLAIFTGSSGESLPALEAEGLLDYFEVIVTGDEIAARKPSPDGILLCLEKLGLAPDRVAYVGDSSIDVTASLAAGVTSFSVLTGAGTSASLHAAGTHRVLPSVASLADVLLAGQGS